MAISKINSLNNLFTRNALRHLIEFNKDDTYTSVIRRYVSNPEGKLNEELISEVYLELKKGYRNEYFYKNTLLNKLLLGIHSINTTTALTEIPIAKSKADFVLINGKAVVYEIKTELDNFDRLESQITDYYKAFDHVAVVTCKENLNTLMKKMDIINKPVGIYILQKKGVLTEVRKPQRYSECLDLEVLFKTMRKAEYEEIILDKFGELPNVSQFKYYTECKKLFLSIPVEEAYINALQQLKRRAKIAKEEFSKVPYELKFLTYFMNLKNQEYMKLEAFFKERVYGGVKMYFPYLRGRQFELIALRELLQKGVLSKKIIPIIEPVKLTSTLIKTMDIYEKENREISLVINPEVGQFQMDCQEPKNEKLKFEISRVLEVNKNLYHTVILTPTNKVFVENFVLNIDKKVMAVCDNNDAISVYEECLAGKDVKYNLIPDDSGFRRKIRNNRVMKEDKFNKLDRNTDYEKVNDEHFSDDHLYYLEDGYIGFSDYSIVGNDYSDTGFAPYAVAIHIVYFDEDNSLRIKHFVSDSNDDISDPAGKFKEALSKLVKWNKTMKLTTSGIKEFENLYKHEAYPGLGTVKKLSIMHHFELIGQFLDKE